MKEELPNVVGVRRTKKLHVCYELICCVAQVAGQDFLDSSSCSIIDCGAS